MTISNNIGFTFIEQSQSQKEVTANAALASIDALMNTGAIDKDLATPPSSPASGDVYIVAASPTGAWAGKAGQVAYYNSGWKFIVPKEGLRLWLKDEDVYYIYNGSAWVRYAFAEYIAGRIDTAANKDYTLVVDMPYGATITQTTTQSGAGTCTANFKINATAFGGTANAVSTSKQSQAHTSANVVVAGDKIVMTVSANAGCTDLAYRITYTRLI